MTDPTQEYISILHDKVPNRIRFRIPLIRYKQTYAEILKQSILRDPAAKGIYHAEPNIVTGTLLVKYHPALHSEEHVVELVRSVVENFSCGHIEILAKHKNPRIGKMRPGQFFTRELVVSIVGNVVAGLILAFMIAR